MERWCYGVHGQTNKKSIKFNFQRRIFTDEALSTFLAEIESIINSCPLTTAGDDINNLKSITENHLRIGKSRLNYQPCVFQEQDISLRKK